MATKRCADYWERRSRGNRYVNSRGQCKRTTSHPSGYCSTHRLSYRWPIEKERAYLKSIGHADDVCSWCKQRRDSPILFGCYRPDRSVRRHVWSMVGA